MKKIILLLILMSMLQPTLAIEQGDNYYNPNRYVDVCVEIKHGKFIEVSLHNLDPNGRRIWIEGIKMMITLAESSWQFYLETDDVFRLLFANDSVGVIYEFSQADTYFSVGFEGNDTICEPHTDLTTVPYPTTTILALAIIIYIKKYTK